MGEMVEKLAYSILFTLHLRKNAKMNPNNVPMYACSVETPDEPIQNPCVESYPIRPPLARQNTRLHHICILYICDATQRSAFHSQSPSSNLHSLQRPNQDRFTQCCFFGGAGVGVADCVVDDVCGSAQIRPNQSLQLEVGGVPPGEEVNDSKSVVVVMITDVTVAVRRSVVVVTGSLQPSQPGWEHVVDDFELVVVAVGIGRGIIRAVELDVLVGVFESLQPNQPGVLHVVVVVVVVRVVVVLVLVVVVVLVETVVDSSKQPHQPGVSHVVVRLLDVVVEELEVVVVLSVWLLSKYSQL
jgi:hypothetical protein